MGIQTEAEAKEIKRELENLGPAWPLAIGSREGYEARTQYRDTLRLLLESWCFDCHRPTDECEEEPCDARREDLADWEADAARDMMQERL